jgi:hypothetical protein
LQCRRPRSTVKALYVLPPEHGQLTRCLGLAHGWAVSLRSSRFFSRCRTHREYCDMLGVMNAMFLEKEDVHALLVRLLHRHGASGSEDALQVVVSPQGKGHVYLVDVQPTISQILSSILSNITGRRMVSRSSLVLYEADVARLSDVLNILEHRRAEECSRERGTTRSHKAYPHSGKPPGGRNRK